MTQDTRQAELEANLEAVLEKIAGACRRAARDPRSVELVAVTKYARTEDIALLAETGKLRHIGESRVLDAAAKWEQPPLDRFSKSLTKHFIGHLQTNKAAKAVKFFDQIDSVDSFRLAAELDRQAGKLGKKLPVLLQLKLTDKDTQSGLVPEKAEELLRQTEKLQNLLPCGYMGIAPEGAPAGELAEVFGLAKKLFDRDFGPLMQSRKCQLSLGMSGDFEAAVEAGATVVRVGSAIFKDLAAS